MKLRMFAWIHMSHCNNPRHCCVSHVKLMLNRGPASKTTIIPQARSAENGMFLAAGGKGSVC